MAQNDGGAAFPRDGRGGGGPAAQDGMSLRDYYVGQALVALVSRDGGEIDAQTIARRCFQIADAIIAHRGFLGADE